MPVQVSFNDWEGCSMNPNIHSRARRHTWKYLTLCYHKQARYGLFFNKLTSHVLEAIRISPSLDKQSPNPTAQNFRNCQLPGSTGTHYFGWISTRKSVILQKALCFAASWHPDGLTGNRRPQESHLPGVLSSVAWDQSVHSSQENHL